MGETDKYLDAFRSTLPVLIDKEMTKVRKQQRGLILMVCVLLGTNLLLLGGTIWVLTMSKTEIPATVATPVEDIPEAPTEPTGSTEVYSLTAAAERAAELAAQRSRAEEQMRQVDAVAKGLEKSGSPIPDHILTERGMSLRSLARRYYGNEVFWVCIYDRNMEVLSSPDVLPLGIRLKLPRPADYGIDADDPSSLQRARKLGRSLQEE